MDGAPQSAQPSSRAFETRSQKLLSADPVRRRQVLGRFRVAHGLSPLPFSMPGRICASGARMSGAIRFSMQRDSTMAKSATAAALGARENLAAGASGDQLASLATANAWAALQIEILA
ncbi:MAG: hypothetical protein L3J49_13435 [Desulfobulbaceae bacterium]|nr:hypothetical protein [Desulfobulbaceae bacterium]